MAHFKFIVLPCILVTIFSYYNRETEMEKQQRENEKIIKEYFDGWEKKDWNAISSLLTEGFTFTSPTDDDHISAEKFYEKCWVQADYIQKFRFIKIIGNGNEAFVTYECDTKSKRTFRNTEYFAFTDGKIKEIEVFFGTGQGYPSNEK
jgi:ketosteroid isomerase-like protein